MKTFNLSENTALLIYVMLITAIIAVLLAWRLVPKVAGSIEVYGVDGRRIAHYVREAEDNKLRFSIDDSSLKVFHNGVTTVFPMSQIRSVDIR